MNILLISDSHGRGMGAAIKVLRPGYTVMTVKIGSVISTIRATYMRCLRSVQLYNPGKIILHLGHNDLQYHQYHNHYPEHGKYFFPKVESFIELLKENHPASDVFYSCPFSRTLGPSMNEKQKAIYNRTVVRLGKMTKSSSSE
jgi:hypothetical protein